MSVIIWRPAQYAQKFTKDAGVPINGALAPAPYDRDTLIQEVGRFSGWKETHYCDVGECELELFDADPAAVKRGNMIMLDGDAFTIEGFRWERGDDGYKCVVWGRDFWRQPESEVSRRYVGANYASGEPFTGAKFAEAMAVFFTGGNLRAGWFRDARRWSGVSLEFANAFKFQTESKGVQAVADLMSYGAEWRMFANWFGVGVRFGFAFDEATGVFRIVPTIYEGKDDGVTFRSDGRGVSAFEYEEDGQAAVNAVYAVFSSKRWQFDAGMHKYDGDPYTLAATDMGEASDGVFNQFDALQADEAEGYAERLLLYSEKHADVGAAPDESDGSASAVMAWLKQAVEKEFQPVEVACSFEYDNSGAYRYGEHFGMGDWLTVEDEHTGVTTRQQLTTVRTNYNGGSAKGYAFGFGNQRITREGAIAKRFESVSMRNKTTRRV